MKKTFLIQVMVGTLLTALSAKAVESRKLSQLEKQRIAWALKVIDRNKVIQQSQDQCLELDKDLIQQLEDEGLINQGTVSPQTICFGGTI